MSDQTRRGFIAGSAAMLATTSVVGLAGSAVGAEHAHHAGSGDGLSVSAAAKNLCGTCRFWGGMRKVSGDGTEVTAQSMGWCNNPDSPNHQKLTAADHQMQKPGIWQKWSVL